MAHNTIIRYAAAALAGALAVAPLAPCVAADAHADACNDWYAALAASNAAHVEAQKVSPVTHPAEWIAAREKISKATDTLADAERTVRSIVDDEAAAETLDQLQAASDRAYAAAKSAAMWSGREAMRRDIRSIVLKEPVSPPPADISQLTLDAWSAVERARDAALMLVCPGR